VSICTRCRYVDVDAIVDHLALIKNKNDHISKLDAKIVEFELENEKFKFSRSMLYNMRYLCIKDDVGFQPRGKDNTKLNDQEKVLPQFVKGKSLIVFDNEGYFIYTKNYHAKHAKNAKSTRASHSVVHHAHMYR
jgi:DNA-dependent RNA polymerase auxiliary subunit epsilon